MATRRRHRSEAGSSIFSKDPYGLVWLALIYLSVMIAKWWFINPANPEDNNCVSCVVAVIWLLSVLVYTVLILFWIGWSRKYEKGTTFVFFLGLLCLLLAVADYYVVQFVVGKLFYGGVLNWQESQASYLIDTFIPHSIGLMLVSSVFYSMLRVLVSRDLTEKPLVYTFAAILLLSVIPLYFLGLLLY